MIIDFHTHTFPDRMAKQTVEMLGHVARIEPQTDATVGGLLASSVQAGIDLSVILPVATKPKQVHTINTVAADVNSRYQGQGVLSIGGIHPFCEEWEAELEHAAEMGLKGIKVHPVYQGADIDSPAYVRILKKAAELGLFVITHAGDDIGYPGVVHCSPEMCRHVTELVPDLTFVLAHMGGWWNWERVIPVLKDTNVYLDTAFSLEPIHTEEGKWPAGEPHMLKTEEFMEIVRAFGADRILFGTDCPWANQSDYIRTFEGLPLTSDERRKIMGENAKKLLGI
ncbi:MAG: amidohydrolase family protein [Solobacterium sp.]|nr:amidohydrolase family protein [Solobacterium sp.]